MLNKVLGFIATVFVLFGMSLMLIPAVGIVFGLLKQLWKTL